MATRSPSAKPASLSADATRPHCTASSNRDHDCHCPPAFQHTAVVSGSRRAQAATAAGWVGAGSYVMSAPTTPDRHAPRPIRQSCKRMIDHPVVAVETSRTMAPARTFAVSHGPVTAELFVRLATLLNDFNPVHYDTTFAQAAGLPGVIGPGTLL